MGCGTAFGFALGEFKTELKTNVVKQTGAQIGLIVE
jgi:hypothetical protein